MHVETQDMWLTAFLSLIGLELHQLKDYGPRKLFVFKDDETFKRLKRNYYFNEGSVDPLELKNKIRVPSANAYFRSEKRIERFITLHAFLRLSSTSVS